MDKDVEYVKISATVPRLTQKIWHITIDGKTVIKTDHNFDPFTYVIDNKLKNASWVCIETVIRDGSIKEIQC